MPLRGILYKKLKHKIDETKAKRAIKRRKEQKIQKPKEHEKKAMQPEPKMTSLAQQTNGELIKGSARYWGGHFLYPIKTVELGELAVSKNSIVFVKYGFLRRPEWSIEIPLSKVEWKNISQATEDDGMYNITCFIIPFKDDKGIRHQPKFSVENSGAREKFSKFLYQKMSR